MKLFLLLFIAAKARCACENKPVFSSAYSVQGILYIPYAELKEPFAAWYDKDVGLSRIDYYGGMVQTLQLSEKYDYGTSLKIAPMTNEEALNARTCFQINGTEKEQISAQTVLPDLSNFKCIGTEMVNGVEREKWRLVDSVGEKVSKYTMWITWQKSPKTPRLVRPLPVRYEMKGYNSLLGSHYDHYYLDYNDFSPLRPPPEVFRAPNVSCVGFPGPGVDHVYSFNPMREFVHGEERHLDRSWEEYVLEHGKDYSASRKEAAKRKEIYRQNIRLIHSTNRRNLGYTLAANHLADRSDAELRALRGRRYSGEYNGGLEFPYVGEKADVDSLDWRLWGAVTPVKDQSVCGSCWSFGTTGTIEGAYFVKSGRLLRLSQQSLIDCSWGYGNNGCDGGEDFRSYQWIMKHGGLPLESDYGPYYGQDAYCHVSDVQLHAPITGYVNVTPWDENALRVALLRHGPVSVAIDASQKTFTFYNNGIYSDPSCKNKPDELDHAVLVVGFGQLNGQRYWLVKNSWSNLWGNDGYVLMSPVNNVCGVMTTPTYVNM